MTTYPPAPLLWQQKLLADNTHSQIAYVGYEGTTFHISGPQAPILGAQSGCVMQSVAGLHAPFKHLDSAGARQDGTTWYDSLYDPAQIDMVLELGGMNASDTRKVISDWMGAWDPKKLGKLTWFSPERGEWFANVRMAKAPSDTFKYDFYQSNQIRFTWSMRNDDAFWQSVPSTDSFGLLYATVTDNFNRSNSSSLGANWTQTYSPTSSGTCGITSGGAAWQISGHNTCTVKNYYNAATTATDNQVISTTFDTWQGGLLSPNVANDIWGRWDGSGNGIRMRVNGGVITLSRFISGVETVMNTWVDIITPLPHEKWALVCGTSVSPREFLVQRGDFTFSFTELDAKSHIGSSYRGYGFGMEANGDVLFSTQDVPARVSTFTAADNVTATQSGFLSLTNIGDQDGWPSYLFYGPGTVSIADGTNTGTLITFGPLLEGQIALITTLPRLRTVTDLSPSLPPQPLNAFQELVDELVSFATNNNVPPLLQQFESLFGILPPQGSLYSLLNGRFTTPIPPMLESEGPQNYQIPVTITNGGPQSRIIGSITPLRRWPE